MGDGNCQLQARQQAQIHISALFALQQQRGKVSDQVDGIENLCLPAFRIHVHQRNLRLPEVSLQLVQFKIGEYLSKGNLLPLFSCQMFYKCQAVVCITYVVVPVLVFNIHFVLLFKCSIIYFTVSRALLQG